MSNDWRMLLAFLDVIPLLDIHPYIRPFRKPDIRLAISDMRPDTGKGRNIWCIPKNYF